MEFEDAIYNYEYTQYRGAGLREQLRINFLQKIVSQTLPHENQ
jgi:hypothetical protein